VQIPTLTTLDLGIPVSTSTLALGQLRRLAFEGVVDWNEQDGETALYGVLQGVTSPEDSLLVLR